MIELYPRPDPALLEGKAGRSVWDHTRAEGNMASLLAYLWKRTDAYGWMIPDFPSRPSPSAAHALTFGGVVAILPFPDKLDMSSAVLAAVRSDGRIRPFLWPVRAHVTIRDLVIHERHRDLALFLAHAPLPARDGAQAKRGVPVMPWLLESIPTNHQKLGMERALRSGDVHAIVRAAWMASGHDPAELKKVTISTSTFGTTGPWTWTDRLVYPQVSAITTSAPFDSNRRAVFCDLAQRFLRDVLEPHDPALWLGPGPFHQKGNVWSGDGLHHPSAHERMAAHAWRTRMA